MTLKELFFKNLNNFVYESGKQQVDISRYCHVVTPTVSNWLAGQKVPRIDKLESICKLLAIRPADLYIDHDAEEPLPDYNNRVFITAFNTLNKTGQKKALDYIHDLTEQEKYTSHDQ